MTSSAAPPAPGGSFRGRFSLVELLPQEARADFLAAAHVRTVQDGHIIYQQGDVGREMYTVLSGEVRLYFLHADGRELVLTAYEPGDSFGYSTLIDSEPLPHTVEAIGQVQLQVLSLGAFNRLRAEHRAFDNALLVLLCRYMRLLSAYVLDATLEDLLHRLARRLLQVARPGDDAVPAVRLSQAELSLMLGVSRQTVNKLLKQFEDEGLVELRYGAVRLSDLPGLYRLADPQ